MVVQSAKTSIINHNHNLRLIPTIGNRQAKGRRAALVGFIREAASLGVSYSWARPLHGVDEVETVTQHLGNSGMHRSKHHYTQVKYTVLLPPF